MVFNYKHYIRNSNLLGEYTLSELQNVIEKYPFFQLARILYLKNLYVLKKPEFEVELKKSVIYIYNRAFLYDFLFSETKTQPIVTGDSVSEESIEVVEDATGINPSEETEAEQKSAEADNEEKNISIEETEGSGSVKKEFADNLKSNIADLLDKQLIAAKKKSEEKDLAINQVQIDIEKTYAKDLEKVSNKQDVFVLLDDVNEENESLVTPEEPIDQRRISSTVSYAKDLLEFDYVLKNVVKYNLKEEDNQNFNAESSPGKSFTEWLDSFNKSGEYDKPRPEKLEKQEETVKEEQSNNRVEKAEVKNQIIDNFIQTNPAIKPEDKPFEYEDISTHSVKEDDDLVTDTLARIYYNQARYDKALDAYKKLSLKYPEKNSYFATQIEKINNKLNDLK